MLDRRPTRVIDSASAGPRTALFVVSIYNYHREVFPVVREFADNGWRVAVIVGWLGRLADEAATAYGTLGCAVHHLAPGIAYGDPDAALAAGRPADKRATRPSVLRRLVSVVGGWRAMRRMDTAIRTLVGSIAPDVILCGPFHSCGTFDNAVTRWAHGVGVPVCCYPVSAYHGAKVTIRARFRNLQLGMSPASLSVEYDTLNRVAAWIFPQWTQRRGEQSIFMWDPVRMLAAWAASLLEPDVWQKPSPRMDAVFVFSEFSRRLLEESGYPMRNVVVVGIPLLDGVSRQARDPSYCARLRAHLNLREGDDFILYNVEPSAEHHYTDWDTHWHRFRAMILATTSVGLPVVLSLHPLSRVEDYSFAEGQYGVRISRDYKIYDLYPHCRLAVSFACSTNLVAQVFDKPLVIYDFFDMASEHSDRADEFRLPGALIAHSADAIPGILRQVLSQRVGEGAPGRAEATASSAIRRYAERMAHQREHSIHAEARSPA